jgi:hypothetical protein
MNLYFIDLLNDNKVSRRESIRTSFLPNGKEEGPNCLYGQKLFRRNGKVILSCDYLIHFILFSRFEIRVDYGFDQNINLYYLRSGTFKVVYPLCCSWIIPSLLETQLIGRGKNYVLRFFTKN